MADLHDPLIISSPEKRERLATTIEVKRANVESASADLRRQFSSFQSMAGIPERAQGAELVRQLQAEADVRREEQMAAAPRDPGQIIGDSALSAISGTSNLASSLAQVALSVPIPGEMLLDSVTDGAVGNRRRAMITGIGELNSAIGEATLGASSDIRRASRAYYNRQQAAAEADRRARYGESDGVLGTVEAFADTVGNLADNPTELASMTAEQLPNIAATMATGGLATEARVLLTAERMAARAGTAVTPAIRKAAEEQLRNRIAIGTIAGMETAGSYQQAQGSIAGASPEELQAQFPEVAERLAAGEKFEVIRDDLANRVGLTSAAITAPATIVGARLVAGFERNPFGAAGETALQRLGANAANMAKEGVEETLQNTASQFSQNAAHRIHGDVNQDALEGIGVAAGEGFAAGLGTAGTLQAPSIAANSTLAAGGLAVDGGKLALKNLMARGERKLNENQAPVKEQVAADTKRREEMSAAVDQELNDLGQPLDADAVMGAGSLDRVATLSRVIDAVATEQDGKRNGQYRLYGVKTARELMNAQGKLDAQIDATEDPEQKTRLQNLSKAITELVSHPVLEEFAGQIASVPAEAIQEALAEVPDDIRNPTGELNPDVASTLDLVREMSYAHPEKLTAPAIERATALYQQLMDENDDSVPKPSADDMAQLRLAGALRQAEAVYEKFPNVKNADEVRAEILEKGFYTGETRQPSLREYVATVSDAMAVGNRAKAEAAMDKLLDFVVHFDRRARAFDETANRAIDDGKIDSPVQVHSPSSTDKTGESTRTLEKDGLLGKENYRLILGNEKSRAAIDNVFADSNMVAGYYNALAARFPELGFQGDANVNQAPTWQNRIDLSQRASDKVTGRGRSVAARTAPPAQEPVADAAPVVSQPAAAAAPVEADTPALVAEPAPAADPVEQPADKGAADNAVADDATFQAELAAAQAAFEAGKDQATVDFNSAPTADLSEALGLSQKEYLARVNPGNQRTDGQTAEQITAELDDLEVPARAQQIGNVGDVALMADGNFLYAVQGEQVVGRLGVQNSGTEFAVHPDHQGKGIGRALMRELLLRDPMALSGGLSEAAEKTRLSALRELRDERTPSMAKTFPTLANLPGPEGDLRSLNQFLQGFQLRPGFEGVMAKGGFDALKAQVDAGLPGLDSEQNVALQTVVSELMPQFAGKLVAALKKATSSKSGKRLLGAAKHPYVINEGKPNERPGTDGELWQFGDKLSLHATNFGQGADELAWDNTVLEGMAITAGVWLMRNANKDYPNDRKYVAGFLGKLEDTVSPKELEIFTNSQVQEAFLTDMASSLVETLGLAPNPNAPSSTHKGVSQALGAEIVSMMVDAGILIQEKHYTIRMRVGDEATPEQKAFYRQVGGKHKLAVGVISKQQFEYAKAQGWPTGQFLTLRVAPQYKGYGPGAQDSLRARLGGNGVKALSKLVSPDSVQGWQLNTPHKQIEKKIRGTVQNLSPEQSKILANHNKVQFFRNSPLVDWMSRIGEEVLLPALGLVEIDPDVTNVVDRVRLDGINDGLRRSWAAMVDADRALAAESALSGSAVDQIPVHFPHYLTVNNRVMMDDPVNPQSNKLLREVLVAVRSTMEIGNEAHELALRLMLGQAFEAAGIPGMPKIENQADHQAVVAAVEAALAEGTPLYDLAAAMADQEASAGDVGELIRLSGLSRGTEAMKAFNALMTWNAYNQAKADGESTVQVHLAFEQDGKTDGPSHLISQFGLHRFDAVVVANLSRAGFLFNQPNTALGDVAKELGVDLYGAVADAATKGAHALLHRLREVLEHKATPPGVRNDTIVRSKGLVAQLRLMRTLKKAKDTVGKNDPEDIELVRSGAKHAVTATGYAGGPGAIAAELVNNVQELLYSELTRALNNDDLIDTELANQINALITHRMWFNRKERVWRAAKIGNPIDFTDQGKYKRLELTAAQREAMKTHFLAGLAGALRDGIEQEMSSSLETMNLVVMASSIQSRVAEERFNAAYEAKRLALVAEGKLLPEQSLSMADETALLEEIRDVLPVTQLLSTAEHETNTMGLQLAETARSQPIHDVLGGRGAMALTGGFSSTITRMGFEDPGVRAGALSIIGGGDATMMGRFFSQIRQALNVWDGLEVGLTDLFASAPQINEAVFDAFKFDLLGKFSEQYASALPAMMDFVAKADDAVQSQLAELLRISSDQIEAANSLEDVIVSELTFLGSQLASNAREGALVKQALQNLGLSIDHMAGARRPFVKDGQTVPPEQLVEWVKQEATRLRLLEASEAAQVVAEEELIGETQEASNNSTAILAPALTYDATVALMDARLRSSSNKVHALVWKQIRNLLPTDLVVHMGDASYIRAKVLEMFPGTELPMHTPPGIYLQGQVFLTTSKTETLLHELVHVAVTGLIDRAYAGGKGLIAQQKQAVQELETLAGALLEIDVDTVPVSVRASLRNAQRAIEGLLDQADVGGAVNEFVAWTLTNPELAAHLQTRAAPRGLKALAKKVIAGVRKLLGLPNNRYMETFLEQTLGQFVRLTRVGNPIFTGNSLRPLFQDLGEDPHSTHLRILADELQEVMQAIPQHMRTKAGEERFARAIQLGDQQREAFLAAGFNLDTAEQAVFEMTQTIFASAHTLDSRVIAGLENVRTAALKALTVEDFMTDPTSDDPAVRSNAQRQYDAMAGITSVAEDENKRSTQLANFVALALVHDGVRRKLNTLSMPKPEAGEKTANGQLRAWATRMFDWVSNASLGLSPNLSQRAQLDALMTSLAKSQVKWARTARTAPSAFDKLEEQFKTRMAGFGEWAGKTLAERHASEKLGRLDGFINLALNGIRAATNETAAREFGESVIATTNQLPKLFSDLFAEIVGGTTVNRPVLELLNEARSKVAQVRQRLRDEAPEHVRGLFSKPLSKETWARLVRSVGKTDLQALLGNYSAAQIQKFLEDRTTLDTEIARLEQLLGDPDWIRGSDNLAHYMMTGTQLFNHGVLYRNAAALARMPGFGNQKSVGPNTVNQLDRVITLKAMRLLSDTETRELAGLFADERAGIHALVNQMRARVVAERGKHNAGKQRYNQWKGYVPVSFDPRRQVVLANSKRGAELVKQGYVYLERHYSEGDDPNQDLAYYAISHVGGQATYNQGALQTVEGSVMGVDHLTGRSLAQNVSTVISNKKVVERITLEKAKNIGLTGMPYGLLPVFNESGEVVAYERPMKKSLLEQHTTAEPDLAQSIGMWLGRQAEEEIAREFNGQVVGVLKKVWDDHKDTSRAEEFVDITDPKAPATLQDTWNTIPRETQAMLRQEFGGAVMVRKDMLNNALGYRSASIGDAFTGMGDLPEDVREAIVHTAAALLGKNAYRYLVATERAWQGLIGAAKDVIVVRSGVVALANGISNQFQLVMHGVPVTKLLQVQARKVAETELYLRHAHRIARIQVEMDSTTDPTKLRALERERQGLHDHNRRLSIWPLIAAGELPTIAEGLTEQDQYTLLGDAMKWLSQKAESLPSGVVTAAKYAVVAKDTALYQGLNRMIQFGDFMAKAALYDHLVEQRGKDPAEALRIISERFVNYNLLAGRSRDYLESMGLTWFMNYKIRIQKVVLSTIRENPLRFLLAGAGAEWLGSDSLMGASAPAANWSYALGPGQFLRAHSTIIWNQLFN